MKNAPERKSKMFWVIGDYYVRYLKCWECNESGDMWWCPEAGFTGSTRHHLFEEKSVALEKLVANLSVEKMEIEKLLASATKELSKL